MGDDRDVGPVPDLRVVTRAADGVEQDYRRLFVFAPDAHVVTDTGSRIIDANRRASALFGVPRRRLTSQSLAGFVAERDRAEVHRHVDALVRGRRLLSPEFEVLLALPGREPIVASGRISAMRAAGRDVTHLHWTLRDVTEARQAVQDLETAFGQERREVEHLRELDRWQHLFTAAAAHDLRSPLAGIRAFAETLLEREADLDLEQRRHFLRRIMATTDRITRLLDSLRELDRATRGLLELFREPTDLDGLVREVIEQVDLGGHEVIIATDPVRLLVDADRLGQVLAHLVDNAVTHTPPGTHVRVQLQARDGGAQLVVEDDGPGVPDEVVDRVFAPFVAHPVHGEEAGNGLGLSLVALFVDMHGGTVHHERAPSGGARFVVDLPSAPAG